MASSFNFNDMAHQRPADAAGPAALPPAQSPPPAPTPAPAPGHSSNVTVYQTTGADAYTSPMLAAGESGAPALNPRSCVTCRRRKVRCDKQMPCSNCRRALIPCVFPAPGRAPRQQRPKDPNAPPRNSNQREMELVKRLRKLEGIVEELSGQIEVESPGGKASPDAAACVSHGAVDEQRHMMSALAGDAESPGADHNGEAARPRELSNSFGRLVLDDHRGTSRYVSSGFWSKLNDELDAIREETQKLTDEDADDSDYEATPSDSPAAGAPLTGTDHHAFVMGYRSADVDLQKCHPLPSHATFLWSLYQENIEPLLKILHIPTTDCVMRDARKNSEKLTPGQEALVFSIYFAAVTSLEPDEVEANFGTTKDHLLARHRFALEQSLARANFLESSDIAVVQAFTLFLIVVRRHDESRFSWAMTGLLIRIAQGLGLHRDGQHFSLAPLETEIRRRLWWAILMLDLRSAEELGTDMMISERSYDTQMPSSINDADISPESTELPVIRQGKSDCAVSLVRCEICTLSRQLVTASSALAPLRPQADEESIAARERMLIDVYQGVEHKFLQHVLDESDPLFWVAAMIARVIMAKMCLVIYQPMLFPGADYQVSIEIRQRIYVAAIEIIEYNDKLKKDPRCKQYRWLFKTYTNWHAIAYTLIETCRRPWTALVERGWEAANGYDRDTIEIAAKADHAAAFLPLRKLFARARRHRESEIARLRANQDEARRLDFSERMNPTQARFGPVPGAENTMDQVRERWRVLVRPEGASPFSVITPQPPPPGPFHEPRQGPTANGTAQNHQSQRAHDTPDGGQAPPEQMHLSHEAMQYMDNFMSQPNLGMPEFWNVPSNGGRDSGVSADFQNPMAEPQDLRQQALAVPTQPPKDDGAPAYLWSDPFTVMNTKFDDDPLMEDTDMLGEDFDWQDWSQSIRGLEMESTQPRQE